MRLTTKILKWITCKFLYRVEVHNEEILSKYESYLICPNHSNVFDPAFVYPVQYDLDVYVMAKAELFKKFWFKWLSKRFNIFSIDRENVDVRSMLKSLAVFKSNEKAKLIMFPEGKVVKSDEEAGKIYKKGAAFIASHLDKAIIPVYITRRPKLFHKVSVTYGEPFFVNEIECKNKNKMEFLSKELIRKIYELR